ncbi:carbohydrate ABC transporter permease [Nocardiopsis sp. CT-R113]|uniref:Carbohydrate ABC transporter permease n=1 Tax=Nocardiopsis codii TaxID=3065942 RepID=A0ABU7K7L2_9ACTN|nr:carbohydrate ABC transporter permease [Nocardiopsis sp. CT-R113]MEE2038017.1 carbohydrate ABC transporter permease [Nocardiopsis sp. CT-R113]
MTSVTEAPAAVAGPAPGPAPRRRRRRPFRPAAGLLAWAVGLLFFFPVLWMFLTGFKQESQASTDPPTLFFQPTLDQYAAVLGRDFVPYLLNSLQASVLSTILAIVLGLPAAYALSLVRIPKWRDSLFFFLSTKLLPPVAMILPLYVIAQNLGALDDARTLTLVYTAMNMPIAVWMIRSFLVELPKEVLEAARMDGARRFTEMRRVILPMIAPGLAATALICFIFAWNEFFFAVNLTATRAATVPVFLVGFISGEGLFWARLSAASTMAALPVIIAGWTAQRWLVRGLSLGAVK